jgi:hypothetical protein
LRPDCAFNQPSKNKQQQQQQQQQQLKQLQVHHILNII